jgi:hypothetical protein
VPAFAETPRAGLGYRALKKTLLSYSDLVSGSLSPLILLADAEIDSA